MMTSFLDNLLSNQSNRSGPTTHARAFSFLLFNKYQQIKFHCYFLFSSFLCSRYCCCCCWVKQLPKFYFDSEMMMMMMATAMQCGTGTHLVGCVFMKLLNEVKCRCASESSETEPSRAMNRKIEIIITIISKNISRTKWNKRIKQ